jgi:heme exporter protein CcmD
VNPRYALFIWTSYGLALAVVLWNVLLPRLRRGELKKRLSEADDGAGDEE